MEAFPFLILPCLCFQFRSLARCRTECGSYCGNSGNLSVYWVEKEERKGISREDQAGAQLSDKFHRRSSSLTNQQTYTYTRSKPQWHTLSFLETKPFSPPLSLFVSQNTTDRQTPFYFSNNDSTSNRILWYVSTLFCDFSNIVPCNNIKKTGILRKNYILKSEHQ